MMCSALSHRSTCRGLDRQQWLLVCKPPEGLNKTGFTTDPGSLAQTSPAFFTCPPIGCCNCAQPIARATNKCEATGWSPPSRCIAASIAKTRAPSAHKASIKARGIAARARLAAHTVPHYTPMNFPSNECTYVDMAVNSTPRWRATR